MSSWESLHRHKDFGAVMGGQSAMQEDVDPHPLFVLSSTIAVAAILSFVLLRLGTSQRPTLRKDEAEDYFQRILDEISLDSWSGIEQGCSWTQTDDEVEVTAPLAAGVKARDVTCKILPSSLSVAICGKSIVQGILLKKVRHDDSVWSIEERHGERIFKLTLVKILPTKVRCRTIRLDSYNTRGSFPT